MKLILRRSADVSWGIYIAIFFLIYSSKDSCFFGVNYIGMIKNVGYILTFISASYLILKAGMSNIVRSTKKYLWPLIMLVMVTLLVNMDFSIKFFYEILLFLACGSIVCLIPFKTFKIVYSDILIFLSLCSLIVFSLNIVAPQTLYLFPIHHNETMYPFRFCILSVVTNLEYGIDRNFGIFREPGVYIFYLCIGLLFELFNDKINFKRVIIFVITIMSTFSTAGFMVAGVVMVAFLFFSKTSTTKQRLTFIAISILLLLVAIMNNGTGFIYDNVFGKLFYENDSTASRTGSIYTNINMWIQDLITMFFGNGYTFVENQFSNFIELARGGENNTNTIFKMLAVHGVIYTGIIYSLTFKFCRLYFRQISFMALLVIFMLQSNEDMIVSFHTYLLPFYAIAFNKNRTYESLTN